MARQFDHEKLKVNQAAIQFVAWSTDLAAQIRNKGAVKDQLDRVSTSIPLNIAEGNGKFAIKDRCRFRDFDRGSALECAACLDVLVAKRLSHETAPRPGKEQLFEIVSMLMGLIQSLTSRIREDAATYLVSGEQE
jgi:four helix bundle protein